MPITGQRVSGRAILGNLELLGAGFYRVARAREWLHCSGDGNALALSRLGLTSPDDGSVTICATSPAFSAAIPTLDPRGLALLVLVLGALGVVLASKLRLG
jgi:IPTL-CTERM motif